MTAHLTYRGRPLVVDNVLIDTGSASTAFQADLLLDTGLFLEPTDVIREVRGVGGTEFVFTKRLDELRLGEFHVDDFEIEVGALEYGLNLGGVLGTNFLLKVGAVIDLDRLVVTRSP